MTGRPRKSLGNALDTALAAGIGLLAWLLALAVPAVAEPKLLAACHRGKLYVCAEMLARPRLAAGIRAAIELYLEEIEAKRKACAAGDTAVCETLRREHPDLPKL